MRAAGSHRSEGGHACRVAGEQRHAGLGLTGADVLDGNVLDDHRCHAGDQAGGADRAGDAVGVRLREVPGAGSARGIGGDGADVELRGAASGDDLVGAAERGGRRRADRLAHAVASGQRRRDDHRAEHRPDHDQRAARGTAADVAHAEAHEHGVAQGEDRHDAQHHHERDAEDGGERPDGHSEQLGHGDSPPLSSTTAGTSATATSYISRPGGALKTVTNFWTCSP